MKLLKKKMIFTSVLLTIILCLSYTIPGLLGLKQNVSTRDIDVNNLGILSYEEEVDKILNRFDSYSIDNSDTQITFEAVTDVSNFDFSGIQYLSADAETTTKKYKTNFDIENEKFEIIIEYIQDNNVVYSESVETVPYYDDYTDDYYILMPDGTNVSLSDTLSHDSFEECSVTLVALGIALTAEEVAILLTAVVIVAASVVVEVIHVVVTTVVSWVRSFWSWFRSLWTKRTTTVTTTTSTIALSYTVSISQTKFDVKPYDKNIQLENDKYYVAIADTDDGLLYVSSNPIDNLSALAILTTAIYVKSAHTGSSKSFVVSLYSPDETGTSACLIATEAGTILGSPGAIYHEAKKMGYFEHYHPGVKYTDLSHPHVFFGKPKA